MMKQSDFEDVVRRAALAPSVHNTQPTRWRLSGESIEIFCDGDVQLQVGDPDGRDAALSCGAAVEATVIALSELNIAVDVVDCWAGAGSGLRPVAVLSFAGKTERDPMSRQLELRYTHRGMFDDEPVSLFGWDRADVALITDRTRKAWLAQLNDEVSLEVLRDRPFRKELLAWMRLVPWHRKYAHDGLNREALRLSTLTAFAARLVFGPLWGVCNLLGLTKSITSEADATQSAQAIACFHRPRQESPIETGRAYMRMCLGAAHLGMAGWPMAALSDTRASRDEICAKLAIPNDRRLVQVIRFGKVDASPPPRVRLAVSSLVV